MGAGMLANTEPVGSSVLFDLPDAYRTIGAARNVDYSPLRAIMDWRRQGKRICLVTLVNVEGSGPRSVGSQLAVSDAGDIAGYLTGGCLERELALVAYQTMQTGRRRIERYGRGSRYIDLRLPCGSGIDVLFDPLISDGVIGTAVDHLSKRQPFELVTDFGGETGILAWQHPAEFARQDAIGDGRFTKLYLPPVQVNLFGEGFTPIQLAKLLDGLGILCRVHSDERLTLLAAEAIGIPVLPMSSYGIQSEDAWTASATLFHSHDREALLLMQLLRGQSFYVGAIGGRQAAARRAAQMLAKGLDKKDLDRLVAPAGAISSARTATELALGLTTQILDTARRLRRVL